MYTCTYSYTHTHACHMHTHTNLRTYAYTAFVCTHSCCYDNMHSTATHITRTQSYTHPHSCTCMHIHIPTHYPHPHIYEQVFDSERSRLDDEYHASCTTVQSLRRDYRKYLQSTESYKRKLQASLNKDPPKPAEQDK